MARSALLNVMVNAAVKAGRSLTRYFNDIEALQVSRKGPGDYVSKADQKAEKILHEELEKARPGYSFVMEESGEIKGDDPNNIWYIDPLDGTTNFLHGLPIFAVSIALMRNGRLEAAVIYNPIMDELYTAERGSGAYLNDRRIRVANRNNLHDCIVSTGIPHLGRGDHAQALREQREVMLECSGIRRTGSAAIDLAWTAAGRLDAYWENHLNAWDIAAGILLVREAGGFVSDSKGGDKMLETGSITVGNETIRNQLLKVVKRAETKA